jgi:hypothetical protein
MPGHYNSSGYEITIISELPVYMMDRVVLIVSIDLTCVSGLPMSRFFWLNSASLRLIEWSDKRVWSLLTSTAPTHGCQLSLTKTSYPNLWRDRFGPGPTLVGSSGRTALSVNGQRLPPSFFLPSLEASKFAYKLTSQPFKNMCTDCPTLFIPEEHFVICHPCS